MLWASLGAVFGSSWATRGGPWGGSVGGPGALLGASWTGVKTSEQKLGLQRDLEPTWTRLGMFWSRLGAILRSSWGRLGFLLGTSWASLRLPWGSLGRFGAPHGCATGVTRI